MTYASGQIILASDYMGFRGDLGVTSAYADATAAAFKMAALIGVGFGQRGYGQTTVIPSVAIGDIVTAAQWTALRTAMSNMNIHTGSSLTLQPVVSIGDLVQAEDGSGGRTNIQNLILTLDANRMTASPADMALSTALTSERFSAWTGDIYHEFTVDYGTENAARFFFNTGSEVRFAASRTGGTTNAQNTAVSNMLSDSGTIKFGSTTSSYTGIGGTVASSIGYYGLTGTYQTIFTHMGSGGYANVSYVIQARRENYAGTNGANGQLLRFKVTFSMDGYTYMSTDGTLTSNISDYHPDGAIVLSPPTYATVTSIGP